MKFYQNHLLTIFVSLSLFWVNSNIANAQAKDSIGFNKSQLVEAINWTVYQPEKPKKMPQTVLKLNAGFGNRVAKETVNDDFQKYFSDLRLGFVWNASADFIFKNNYGFGLTFYQFSASLHRHNIQDRITFISPAFVIRIPFDQRPWEFDASIAIGYIEYRGTQKFAGDVAKYYGASVGALFSIGVERKLSPHWGIGFNIHTTMGEITTFHHEKNGEKWTSSFEVEEGEDLSQTGMSIGIRYYFK